jgi:hypothetical protein
MQERYLGDSHDFLKYALLRHISRSLKMRIGVNWYLTRPEVVDKIGNNDGEKRHHLNAALWRAIDPDLHDRLSAFADPKNRAIGHVEGWGILPENTLYFDEPVPQRDRAGWFGRSEEGLAAADIVFLDPDNGFAVPSMTARSAAKYAMYEEAALYLHKGKSVVSIQFARQCDPVRRAVETRRALEAACGNEQPLPVIRGRVAPNILFLSATLPKNQLALADALRAFGRSCAKADIIE